MHIYIHTMTTTKKVNEFEKEQGGVYGRIWREKFCNYIIIM